MEITFDTLYNLYIKSNLSIDELAIKINKSKRQTERLLSKFQIKKPKSLIIEMYKRKQNENTYPAFDTLPNDSQYDIFRLYNIDYHKLSRDYIKYPFTKYYTIPKEELEYLYKSKNLTMEIIAQILNTTKFKIQADLKKYGINKSALEARQSQKIHYNAIGLKHHTQTDEFKEKYKQAMLEKHGVDNYSKTEEFKEKYKQIMLEKHGVDNYFRIFDEKGRKNRTNNHITDENYDIITSKEKLEEMEKNYSTASEMASVLGITKDYLYVLFNKFNINYNFEKKYSSYKKELREYLPAGEYNKKVLGKEIDIFFPSKNIGIEFNGNYLHSELNKSMNYHKNKSKYFADNGIFIYHIFEYEWNDAQKKKIIISQLNNLLNQNTNKIYARKCAIKKIDKKIKSNFLNQNHIQGNDRCNCCYGLFYNDELVEVMTFSKPKFNNHYEWELSRCASKLGYNIVGGASKLFKHFVKEYNPKSIISYSDIAKTKGGLYEKLGFICALETRPNYVWCKGRQILLKSQTRKSKLTNYDQSKSESEILHSLKYYKIYNCGLKQWVWKSENLKIDI